MSKLKTILAMFIMAAVVIAGAFLPNIVVAFQDQNSDSDYEYADMQTAQLRIEDEVSLSTLGKLAMLSNATIVEITEDQTTMNPDEAIQAAFDCLDVYHFSDLISVNYHYFAIDAVPSMLYSVERPGEYNIVWAISLYAPDHTSIIDLVLDDATGTLLSISYHAAGGPFAESDLTELTFYIAELYFAPLSLTPSAENFGESTENTETDAYWFSGTYIFYDDIYNEVAVEIMVSPYGFSTGFLDI